MLKHRCFLLSLASLLMAATPLCAAGQPLPKVRIAQDGRSFETEGGEPFVPFGVNYYRPGTGWAPQIWKQFDADATRKDFARMKELGINCVRVFLTYHSFYADPGVLRSEGLEKFDRFLALAEEAGIYVHPTGPDHWEGPPNWRPVSVSDQRTLRFTVQFWELFAARYRGRHVIFAYDLKNEPAIEWRNEIIPPQWNAWLQKKYGSEGKIAAAWGTTNQLELGKIPVPPPKNALRNRELLDFQSFREDLADEWTRRQAAAIKAADPKALVTVGFLQTSVPSRFWGGIGDYTGFRPERQAKFLDFLEIHFYPSERGGYEYKSEEDELANLAYLEGIVREVARPGKPVVLAEFGWYGGAEKPKFDKGVHPIGTEEQQAKYLSRAVETSAGFVSGWLNWGFYDHPEAKDCSELTGLLRVDGTIKAWGKAFQQLAASYCGTRIPPATIGPRPSLDWDACITDSGAANEFRRQYLKAFVADKPRRKPVAERPNIVFILADDLGYGEVGCYGQKLIQTSNIDRLAAEGMRFTQFYSGCHVCAPSRSTLMTGLHTGNTPVRNNGGDRHLYDQDVTVTEVLRKADYATGGFGKWGLGTGASPGAPWKQGFDEFFGYLHQVHAHFYYPYWLWTNDTRFLLLENEGHRRARYSHDEIHQQALRFIRGHKDKPFFCYIPYTLPHVELTVPEDSLKPYRGKWKETPLPDPRPGYIGVEEPYATFAGMISRLDRSVGDVLALLKDLQLEDNTVVFFSSDNGPQGAQWQRVADFFHGAGPLRGYKGGFYEGGIRVPLIVRWPGKIKPGSSSDQVCAFWDFLPTAADIAGVAPPSDVDGISFLPALLGRPQKSHEFLYWEMPAGQRRTFAVRLGDWKAVQPKPGAKLELYNLHGDLAETNDLAQRHPDLVEKLKRIAADAHTPERDYPPENPRATINDYVR